METQFSRTQLLLGEEALDKLKNARVAAFDFVAFSHGLGHLGFHFLGRRFLWWSSQWFAVGLDFKILEYIAVGLVQVYLVRKDSSRKVAEAFFEKLNL